MEYCKVDVAMHPPLMQPAVQEKNGNSASHLHRNCLTPPPLAHLGVCIVWHPLRGSRYSWLEHCGIETQ